MRFRLMLLDQTDLFHLIPGNIHGDNNAALRDATAAAEDAAEKAKSWVAKRGRQQCTGDRSSGTPDPGMVAIATILGALCTEFGVSRTAVRA